MNSSTLIRRIGRPARSWPPYAAAVWLVVFVLWHLPVALGWTAVATGTAADAAPVSRIVFHAYNGTLMAMASAGVAVVLATVRPWGRRIPRRLLTTPLLIGSTLLVVRGVPGFAEFILQVTGVAPAGLMGGQPTTGSVRWAEYAINLYFFLGALLLVPTTRRYLRGAS
jgi:hypothetical protein